MAQRSFPWLKTFVLGFGFFGISIIWPLFNSLIPPMLEDLGLSAVVIGFILTWDNIINIFFQPWVGSRSDRTRTRFGRRKPWLMLGAPLAALFFILVPFVRDNFVLIALAILGTNIGMALFRSPTIAYLGDLFEPGERSKANGVINLMGGVGGAIALFGGGALYKLGVPLPFIVGAAILLLAIAIVLWLVKEPDLAASRPLARHTSRPVGQRPAGGDRSRPERPVPAGGHLLLVRGLERDRGVLHPLRSQRAELDRRHRHADADRVRGHADHLRHPQRPDRHPFRPQADDHGRAGRHVGRRLRGFFVRNPTVLLVVLAVMGGFWALVNINSLPMVYDLAGKRSIGAYTGLYYFASSLAAITGPILAGWLIDWTGHTVSGSSPRSSWRWRSC